MKMRTDLPVVSFLCTGLIVLLSPVWLHTRNAAVISLAAWLLCCSLIHGINALLWSGNSAIHVPVWCDIGKKTLAFHGAITLLTEGFLLS